MQKKLLSVILILILICSLPFGVFAEEDGAEGLMASYVQTSAKAALFASLDTGDILYQKNIDVKVYPASITKIMTVTVMLESPKYDPNGMIEMTDAVGPYITGTGSAVSDLKIGEQFTQLDLMYLTLMKSSGDCAYLGALYYGDTVENFMQMMNDKASALGLTGTHYGNPVGLHDEETYTTARDIYTLTKYALQNETFKTICSSASYQMPATNLSDERFMSSTNELLLSGSARYYPYATGVKTGFTDEAGRCLVSTASYNGMNYISVVMGCPGNLKDHFGDSADFFRTAFSTFELRTINKGLVSSVSVRYSREVDHVTVNALPSRQVLLPIQADDSTVEVRTRFGGKYEEEGSFPAPIKKGDVLGRADLVYAGQVIDTVDLVAGEDVPVSRIERGWDKTKHATESVFGVLGKFLKYILIGAAILIVGFVALVWTMNRKRKRRVRYIPYKDGEERDD